MLWQFMTVKNEKYLEMYDIADQAKVIEGQLESTLLRLKENEDLIKRMEAAEIAQADELSKLREELIDHDRKIKALLDDKVDRVDKATNLEAKAWVVEEYVKEVRLAKDVEVARKRQKRSWRSSKILKNLLLSSRRNMRRVKTWAIMPELWTSSTTSGSSTEILTTISWERSS